MRPHLGEHDEIAKTLAEFEEWHNETYSKKMKIVYEKKKDMHYCMIKIQSSRRPFVASDKMEHIAAKKALEIVIKKTGYKKIAKVVTNEKENFVRPVLRKETA